MSKKNMKALADLVLGSEDKCNVGACRCVKKKYHTGLCKCKHGNPVPIQTSCFGGRLADGNDHDPWMTNW